MMHFPCFARLDDQADTRALGRLDQMMMNRRASQQRTDSDTFATHVAIRQHDKTVTVSDGLFRFRTQAIKCLFQTARYIGNVIGYIDGLRIQTAIIHRLDRRHIVVIQDRVFQRDPVTTLFIDLKQIAFRPDVALE